MSWMYEFNVVRDVTFGFQNFVLFVISLRNILDHLNLLRVNVLWALVIRILNVEKLSEYLIKRFIRILHEFDKFIQKLFANINPSLKNLRFKSERKLVIDFFFNDYFRSLQRSVLATVLLYIGD